MGVTITTEGFEGHLTIPYKLHESTLGNFITVTVYLNNGNQWIHFHSFTEHIKEGEFAHVARLRLFKKIQEKTFIKLINQ